MGPKGNEWLGFVVSALIGNNLGNAIQASESDFCNEKLKLEFVDQLSYQKTERLMIHRKLCRVYWLSGQELLEPLNGNTMPAYYTLLLVIPMVSLVLDTLIGVWMRGPPTELFWLYLVLLGLKLAVNLGRCPQRSSKNRVPIGSTAR